MQREVDRLDEHVIVCGYGRFGRVVVQDLVRGSRTVVVIEQDPSLEAMLLEAELPHLIGSATSDDVLHRAGIERATAIVVALSSESDGVFVTLSARELAPSIKIHARGESEAAVRRLRRAGADHVTSPIRMGGLRAAESILRPAVVDLLEISSPLAHEEIDLEEIRIGGGAAIDGSPVHEVEAGFPRLRIVALKREGSPIEIVPERDAVVSAGDHVVVIGERAQLADLAARALAPGEAPVSRAT